MIKITFLTLTTISIFASVNEFNYAIPTPVQIKEDSKLTATRLALIEAKAPRDRLETLTRSCYYAGMATNNDPVLIVSIIAPESEYKITARSKKGYKSLMQTEHAIMKWEYAEANIMAGACCLREKMQIAKGDINLAMALYKGGKSKEARDIAKKQLEIYRDLRDKIELQMKG
jgi:soluble lytic murein transglycosylase-like protein